ncbi:hypothetical protein B0I31_11089 [Saccharothrix carnea]|uniref:AAA+ ATPase domain-containing protein n=1 Tax=Saccharothrix carnea TaxID=1280637 RepID=A0A2P8I3E9_SACCR|nr:hypothetical protein [Saccharothrix carnea]PSL52998.1 hypothetical protein B0I31_11089 [Saccharothrix carnea]
MSARSDLPPPRKNPFSPMAVARITDFDADPDAVDVAITTDATRQALAHLASYLDAPPTRGGRDRTGTVVAVLGDYGTGKTHLAVRLVRHARQVLADPTHALYLDATAESFIELYRRFMQKLGREGVRAQVSEYYADIVADSLQSSGLTSDMLEWLGSRQLEPQEVVERLGLMESALLRKVQDTLREVTNNKDFGTALTLLLRPGFEHSVWSWLLGGTPDQVLVERGITTPIDTEVAALEAMGVFALLFGGRQRRFVLAVDELDKIFSADSRPQAGTMAAFQTLLQVFAKAGACLVLCGLPDFKSVLPPAVRQRIPYTVVMSGLSQREVREFIELAQQQAFGTRQLAPFTVDTTRYLRDIARGNARNVIRLCHRVFRMADDLSHAPGGEFTVTEEMVRQAARDLFGSLSSDDIDGVVRRLLDAGGLDYLHRHLLGVAEESLADFWVTFPEHAGGCAVLITRSLLDNADVAAVLRRVSTVREAEPDAELILLVNGVVADGVAIQLRELLGREPLVYVDRTFADDFKALVSATGRRLGGDTDPMSALRWRMDQLAKQQSSIYGFIEHLAEHMDGVRASSDRQLGAIQRQLAALAGGASGTSGGTPVREVESSASRLPGEVERLFRDAVDALEDLTQVDVMFEEAFDHAPTTTQEAVHRRLRTPEFAQAATQAVFMQKAVQAFRAAVSQWYSSAEDADAEDRLEELCGIYDGIVEFLPLFLLDPLFKLPPWSARSGGLVAEVSQGSRRTRVHEALRNLSPRVRRAVFRSSRLT